MTSVATFNPPFVPGQTPGTTLSPGMKLRSFFLLLCLFCVTATPAWTCSGTPVPTATPRPTPTPIPVKIVELAVGQATYTTDPDICSSFITDSDDDCLISGKATGPGTITWTLELPGGWEPEDELPLVGEYLSNYCDIPSHWSVDQPVVEKHYRPAWAITVRATVTIRRPTGL